MSAARGFLFLPGASSAVPLTHPPSGWTDCGRLAVVFESECLFDEVVEYGAVLG